MVQGSRFMGGSRPQGTAWFGAGMHYLLSNVICAFRLDDFFAGSCDLVVTADAEPVGNRGALPRLRGRSGGHCGALPRLRDRGAKRWKKAKRRTGIAAKSAPTADPDQDARPRSVLICGSQRNRPRKRGSAPRLRVFRTRTTPSCLRRAHCSPSDSRGCDSNRSLAPALLPLPFAQRQMVEVSSVDLLQAGFRDR